MTSNDIIFCTNETCSKRTVCRRGQKPTFTFASFCPFEPQCDTVERFRCDHFWPVNGEICNVCGHSLFLHAEYDYTGDTIRCCDCTVDGGFALAARWMGWETVAFVEREPFCQKVLRKNFREDIETHDDITTCKISAHQ